MRAQQPFAGAVGGDLRLDHLWPGNDKMVGKPGVLRLGDIGHRGKVRHAAIIDPVPDLLATQLGTGQVLVLTDIFGATPCNVAQRLVDGVSTRLIAGVSLPMLLRAVTYRHESLDMLVSRALAGGTQGIIPVAVTAPQNQNRRSHDQNHHDHQQ